MSGEWGWYWGLSADSEEWFGPFSTREEAVTKARKDFDPPVFVVRAEVRAQHIADWIGLDTLLEEAEERFSESDLSHPDFDPEVMFDCTTEQEDDLLAAIRAACEAWQERHGLKFKPKMFTDMDQVERIDAEPGSAA